ncbi:MAG: helix-turn-helix domain-containing protein [Solirubrobacterales bacterium]
MTAPGPRPQRADAARNRQLLIAAAIDVFCEDGLDASVAKIAKRAGVGTGTLFRNFATKDDLIEAVVEARMTQLDEIGSAALTEADPLKGFEQFIFAAADLNAADRGFSQALHQRVIDRPELQACKQRAIATATKVLKRAQAAGVVRKEIVAEDLRVLMMSAINQDPELTAATPNLHHRYLRIMLDGLRPEGASRLPADPVAAKSSG